MASISCRHVKKVYPGNVTAVPDFSLEIADKEFIVFVGPSGCGKSTLLKSINRMNDLVELKTPYWSNPMFLCASSSFCLTV